MKSLYLTICLFAVVSLEAQDETIFNSVRRVGAFGGPIFEYEDRNNDDINTLAGGGGGVIINDFFFGGYGIDDINFDEFDFGNSNFQNVKMRHAGLWFGATPGQRKAIHPYLSMRIGWGRAQYEEGGIFNIGAESDRVMVYTPEAGLEINIFKFFRVAASAQYRFIDGLESTTPLEEDNIERFGGTLTLRFGSFGSSSWWD